MTATVEPATVESAAMESESVTVESAAVESVTVEPITVEFAEAFAAESVAVEGRVAVTVRGIAVVSVTPPCVGTSRQPKDPNQKRAKDNQFYFHYLMRRQAGRMTSGAEELLFTAGLATAATAFRTPASVLTLKPEH